MRFNLCRLRLGGDVKRTASRKAQREVVDFNRKSMRVLETREHNRRNYDKNYKHNSSKFFRIVKQ